MNMFKRKLVEKHGKNCDNLLCEVPRCQPKGYSKIIAQLRKDMA